MNTEIKDLGIKDINGKKVYEGDKTIDGVIEYSHDVCGYIIRRDNGTFVRLEVRRNKLEIIGKLSGS